MGNSAAVHNSRTLPAHLKGKYIQHTFTRWLLCSWFNQDIDLGPACFVCLSFFFPKFSTDAKAIRNRLPIVPDFNMQNSSLPSQHGTKSWSTFLSIFSLLLSDCALRELNTIRAFLGMVVATLFTDFSSLFFFWHLNNKENKLGNSSHKPPFLSPEKNDKL